MSQQLSNAQMDPWSTGTTAYRAALIIGMAKSLIGIILIVASGMTDTPALQSVGLVTLGIGMVSHLVGIGLRKRQAAHMIRARGAEEDAERNSA
ncbi:hypothetical protein [Nesterenkonia pannonica]|uniref:hypothetical protein n=1 Tax=Nesterenkonia pannonica TaxID=1548602 RepID=UPI0021641737|nr:hypothetical protein [Nesterenkonia pannonica]